MAGLENVLIGGLLVAPEEILSDGACEQHVVLKDDARRVAQGHEVVLSYVMDIFRKHDVYVVSDEIWSDIILSGKHIPTQSVSEDARMRTVALYAPSKTFNLAGLVGSYRIVYDPYLRDRIAKESSLSHYNGMHEPVVDSYVYDCHVSSLQRYDAKDAQRETDRDDSKDDNWGLDAPLD